MAPTIRFMCQHLPLLSALLCLASGCTRLPTPAEDVAPADVAAIRGTIEAYRNAWLAGDAEGVLATFTEDAVLLPHHGDPPNTGKAAIRIYWFAPGPPTTISELGLRLQRGGGVRGWGRDGLGTGAQGRGAAGGDVVYGRARPPSIASGSSSFV